MIRFKNIFLARAAMTLLVAVLTAATAWAQSLTGSGTAADPYIINSDAAYEAFATKPAYWASGVYVRLTADVSTTKMVGTSSYNFQGYFFGNGHTLTVNLSSSAEFCAPFCYAEGATIIGLHTAGTVTTNSFKYGSGLIGEARTNVTIRNCWSSVTIVSDVSGDGTHGGFIGVSGTNVVIKNSLFDGVICCTSENRTNSCGGFVGWHNNALTIENCLFAPAAIPEGKYAIGSYGTSTFARNDNPTLTNSYYTTALGTTQGMAVGSKNATELASALSSGWQVSGEKVVPVMVSNNLADAIISGVEPYYLYTGSEIPVTYTVTDINGNLLTLGTDYTATFSPATVQASGDYTLTLTGTSNYTGTRVINFTVGDGIPVTSETTTFEDGLTYKVTSNVTVSSRITVSGTVKLLLGEGATLTASKGIELSNGNQLTIDGTGTLTSNGNAQSKSGIGAYDAGTLIINGGVINAKGGPYAAGIGGDEHNGNGGRIIINGGVVNATGGSYGAGIGGGQDSWGGNYGQCGNVTINGGQVTATGGNSAPGIGPGCDADYYSGTVTLGWTNTTDFIYASSYSDKISTLTFADGKHFVLDGTTTVATTLNIGGKTIVPLSDEMGKDLTYAVITGVETSYNYTGSAISIVPVVKDANNNTLTLDTDYTLALTLNGEPATEVNVPGAYTLTLTAKDGSIYTGSTTVNFSVISTAPTDLKQTTYAADGGTMTWTENGIATQWTLQYSTKSDFSSDVTTVENLTATTFTATGLTAETTYYVRVKSVVGSIASEWCTGRLEPTATKWIGFGSTVSTGDAPTQLGYKYSLSQQIYTAEEIGKVGVIESIAFRITDNTGGLVTRNLDVYLVHTDKTAFSGQYDWVKVNEADKVFSGNVDLAKDSWFTITFDAPFAYNGTSNLAVVIDDNTGTSSVAQSFAAYSVDSYSLIRVGSNTADFNPLSYKAEGLRYNLRNQIRIGFGQVLQLADNDSEAAADDKNGAKIEANDAQKKNVMLDGRTLKKNDQWNTICLPFDVTLDESPLAGATAKTLTGASIDGNTVTLTFGDDVETLSAGVPYIIKWESGADIVNPVFTGVTIDKTDRSITKGDVQFKGYYDAFGINATNTNIYYMTAGNTLRHTGVDRTLKACRAYFQFTEPSSARSIVLNFGDDETTAIRDAEANSSLFTLHSSLSGWYTVDGVKLDKKPTRKGLYIFNGNKIVIR